MRRKFNFRKHCRRHGVDVTEAPPILLHCLWFLQGDGGGWSCPAAEHKDRIPSTDGIAGHGDASHPQEGTWKELRGGEKEPADGVQVRAGSWKERRRNQRSVMMVVCAAFNNTLHLCEGELGKYLCLGGFAVRVCLFIYLFDHTFHFTPTPLSSSLHFGFYCPLS